VTVPGADAAAGPGGTDAVRRSEERLRLVLEATGAGVWDTHLGTGETYISPRLEAILGYAVHSCPRQLTTFVRHVVPEHRTRVMEQLRASVRTGDPFALDCRIRDARQTIRTLHVRGHVLADGHGHITRSVGVVVDITTEAAAREQQLAQERQLARAQEIARIGSWTWEFSTQSLSWSAEFYRIMELDPHTVAPSQEALWPLISTEDRERLRVAHEACITHDTPVDLRYRLHLPDGRERHVHARAELLRSATGRPLAIVGTTQDVTEQVHAAEERARLEAQVHHAHKLESLGLLAGGIAHDFNNLLVGVLSNASLALLDLDEQAPARQVVLEIERTAQRAADLTRQLLAYSGKGRFVVEPLQLSALAGEMAQLLRTVVSKDAALELELDDTLPPILGDATQLRQVIMNLITNASDALQGRRGTVTVRTRRHDGVHIDPSALHFGADAARSGETVCLEVIDTGIGMTRATAERIFDPFFSTKFTGRGLGLAATLGIVRGHHGAISVESTPGRGTRFVLRFPVTATRTAAEAPTAAPVAERHRGRVLVVDDDSVVRSVATALLARRGFEVLSDPSGQAALDRLSAPEVDVRFVLLDLTMPGLTGIEVLQRLRTVERDAGRTPTTVFLMSGYSEQEVTSGAGDLAVAGFLQKPFTIADVDTLLATLPDA
jgi:two-component system, cell cycle sensor histidine kinase and response regulator CckA